MRYSEHVGRVGALAVALGIGSAVIAWPGVAFAGPEEGSDPPAAHSDQDGDASGGDAGVSTPDDDPAGPGVFRHGLLRRIAAGVVGASTESGRRASSTIPSGGLTSRKVRDTGPAPADTIASSEVGTGSPVIHRSDSPTPPRVVRAPAGSTAVDAVGANARTVVSPVAASTAGDDLAAIEATVPDAVTVPPRLGLHIVTGVLAAVLSPFATPPPGDVPPPPALFAILAWVRREFQHDLFNQRPTLVADTETEQLDGDVVTGHVTGADPDGDALTYSASGGATGSHVEVDEDGNWTYTAPEGAVGNETYTDSFTITTSDGSGHLHGLFGSFSPDGGHTRSVHVDVGVDPETGSVVIAPPPDADGKVAGSLGVSGPIEQPVVTVPPKYGTLVFDLETGTYVYTPNQAGRLRAGLGLETTDSFTVNVVQAAPPSFARAASFSTLAAEDQVEGDPITVSGIQVAGAVHLTVDGDPIPVGHNPAGVVLTDTHAYVLNTTDGTVTVIELATGDVIDTDSGDGDPVTPLTVGTRPILGAAAGNRLYVPNSGDGTISVINTDSNTVIGTITVAPGAMLVQPALTPDGKHLYVVSPDGVYVVDIDTANDTYTVVDSDPGTSVIDPIQVKPQPDAIPASIAFSQDGKRLYVATFKIVSAAPPAPFDLSSETVVVDTDPDSTDYNTVVAGGIDTQAVPSFMVVINKKLYANQNVYEGLVVDQTDPGHPVLVYPTPGRVIVVDVDPASPTYNDVKYIEVGTAPVSVTPSPDKSLLYVVNAADGTVSVIDVAADDVLTTFTYTATPSVSTTQFVGVSPDGTHLYITRIIDDTVTTATIA